MYMYMYVTTYTYITTRVVTGGYMSHFQQLLNLLRKIRVVVIMSSNSLLHLIQYIYVCIIILDLQCENTCGGV